MASNNDTVRFLLRLTGLQSGDVDDALDNVQNAGLDVMDFARYTSIDRVMRGNDMRADSLEFIIEESGAYELNDYVSGDTFDIDSNTASEILAKIPTDSRGQAWEWLVDMTGAIVPDDSEDDDPLMPLVISAIKACESRGHKMTVFEFYNPYGNRTTGKSTCKVCGKWVQIDSNPPPNGIDIGGPAVAVGCEEGAK